MENNLKIFIAELSEFNNKLTSKEKLSLRQDLSSSTWINFQRAIKSRHSLCLRVNISSHFLTKMENWMSTQEKHSRTLPLFRKYCIPNYLEQFSSEISSFWSFIFYQQWYRNSQSIYCSSLHWTVYYSRILWKNYTQFLCLNHTWP